MLRGSYDLGKNTSLFLPQIRGTLQPTSEGAACNCVFPYPKFEALFSRRQRGVVCSPSTRYRQKDVLFPAPNPRHPAADVRGALFALAKIQGTLQPTSERRCVFFFHVLRAPRDISPSLLTGDCPLASADRVAISIAESCGFNQKPMKRAVALNRRPRLNDNQKTSKTEGQANAALDGPNNGQDPQPPDTH